MTYTLGLPNEEVRKGLIESLYPNIIMCMAENMNLNLPKFVKDLRAGRIEDFLLRLQVFFKTTPNTLNNKTEKHFRTMLYVIMRLIGQFVTIEEPTSIGRMDMVIRANSYLYILEFKVNKSAEIAIGQIEKKEYAAATHSAISKL